MVEVICAVVAGLATVVCAIITTSNSQKIKKSQEVEDERLAEAKLQLEMISANTELTVGVAMALKNGHCNGEVENGLTLVKQANDKYKKFLEEIALKELRK